MSKRIPRTVLALLAALSSVALNACASQESTRGVTVLAPRIDTGPGSEGYAFHQVLAAFTEETGIPFNYQETRALSEILLSNVPSGTLPDIAMLSSLGDVAKYSSDGKLHPLDDVLDAGTRAAFSRLWLFPKQDGDTEHIYTVPIKANLKSIIWFNPTLTPRPTPRTWDELVAYSHSLASTGIAPWCIGVGDAPSSGWPGIDMIDDILLHRFGADFYHRWARGSVPWTSPEVRGAWIAWGDIATDPKLTHGGSHTALLTDFKDAGRPMFRRPPGCFLEHQASFIMGFYQGFQANLRPGVDFDFFPFPSPGTRLWEISIDLAGMFNDTPQARALIRFLATDKAQRIWPGIAGGSAFTVSKNVSPEIYGKDLVSKRIAQVFASNDTLCFGGADLMPTSMRSAYNRAVLEYLSNPAQIDSILMKLEQIRTSIPQAEWLDLACTQ